MIFRCSIIFLLLIHAVSLKAQPRCTDLAVSEIRCEKTNKGRAGTDLYRVTVLVKNAGQYDFTPAAGNDIHLYFTGKGYHNREMAVQPAQAMTPGQTSMLVFEFSVNQYQQTLPDWENIPFPQEICARVIILRRNKTGDCNEKNNSLCTKKTQPGPAYLLLPH